uniref:Uncharacterized protein n=1 Tax=viral metagenome TaxID=1070528 RepID=A0A6H1ZFU2_9ZZZZ
MNNHGKGRVLRKNAVSRSKVSAWRRIDKDLHWYTDGDAVSDAAYEGRFQKQLAMMSAYGNYSARRRLAS